VNSTHLDADTRPTSPTSPTVEDVLGLPAMSGSEILAGGAGLDREVSGVNIIEVPDVRRWLTGGEFLFTSAFPWRDDLDALADVIVDLDRVGVAAIGFKLGPYLDAVPAQVLAAADRVALPLLRLPSDVPYMRIIEPLYQQITARRLWTLERSVEIKGAFAAIDLAHESIDDVVTTLATEVGSPAYVLDLVNEEVVFADPGEEARRTAFEEAAGDAASVVAEGGELSLGRTPTAVALSAGRAIGVSVMVARRVEGKLFVLEGRNGFSDVVELALAHAAELLSFIVTTRLSRIAGRKEAAKLFLDSLMSDHLSDAEAAERAITLGLHLNRPCAALVVGCVRREATREAALARAVGRAAVGVLHVADEPRDGQQLVLLQCDDAAGVTEVARRIEERAAADGVGAVVVATGRSLAGVDGIRRSRSEATIAYRTALQRGTVGVVSFEHLGVERVLSQIPMNDTTLDYVTTMLGPVLEDDELLRTLETFLDNGGSKVATAAAIPLHRSSLMYRLKKLERLLDADLDDPVLRLELWLAVRLHRITELSAAAASHA
jgi:purine catabolism regulator